MPRPTFNHYYRQSDRNDHPRHDEAALQVRRNRECDSTSGNRYHPYQRPKKENENSQQECGKAGPSNRRCFSFSRLRRLGEMNSDECVAEIAAEKAQFKLLLDDDFRPDLMVVTVQVLANVCRANFSETVTSILSHACSARFLNSLQSYLADLPHERSGDKLRNQLYWESKSEFWYNLVKIFKKMTRLLPSKARDELVTIVRKVISIMRSIERNQYYKIRTSVKDTIHKIYDELKEEMVKFAARNERNKTSSKEVQSKDPPKDFRSLSVVPTIDDLNDNDPFIRPSKHKGAYDSVERYLDIQFRLLREDFISPLRDGIKEYLHGLNKNRNSQLRVYRNVKLLSLEEAGNNLGVIASFGSISNIDWKTSKRFLFGGLLCLSSDNFKSVLFATVVDRDEDLLQKGRVLVKPCHNTVLTQDHYHSEWVMLESKIYFEPYQAVLNALLQMNHDNFPMKRYLIDADTSVSLPSYLRPKENENESEDSYESDENDADNYESDENDEDSYESDEDGYDNYDEEDYDDEDNEEDYDDEDNEDDYDDQDDDDDDYYDYDNGYYNYEDGYDGYEDGEEYSEDEEDDDDSQNECRDEQEDRYKNAVLSYKGFSLPIGKDEAWPMPGELKLDASQYKAFKSALCQEFAIIQGPPGTGKTFISLEIIRTLLENKSYWRDDGPIVIVCLTNHALDQFLEGILKHTKSVVRVGRQSKSEALFQYTLAQRRKTSGNKCRNSGADRFARHKKFAALDILRFMDRTRLALKHLTTKDAIVPLSLLNAYCDDKELRDLNSEDALLGLLLENNNDPVGTAVVKIEEGEAEEQTLPVNSDSGSFWNKKPLYPLEAIDIRINDIQREIEDSTIPLQKKAKYEPDVIDCDPTEQLEKNIVDLKKQRSDTEINLSQHPLLTPSEQEVSSLNPHWQNYWKWVKLSHKNAVIELANLERDYRQATQELNEAWQMVDLEVLKKYDIIGLTTTAAARLHASLSTLNAPIVLVEEAAEILESHVVCSLTKSCQHVILIGDHKQLRPKAAVYELGTKYNLNISLFERMVNIREGACTQLAHQHRMRPEIARLICPSIYETLHNHKSVLEYPSVMGMAKNVFFLNHEHREEFQDNQDSWMNHFEAKFLVSLARHLIFQGYKSTEITILCTYAGQLSTLMKERQNHLILKDVRISTVDNFQGEENRIILLSLVRNNEDGNIGFLKEENRVCVALSRAREGLFILGNMENLTTNNNVWPKIKGALESSNAIGDSLELRCQFHPDRLINVRKASDFEQCPKGGCSQRCNTDLPCGHRCDSICHATDREHLRYACRKPCLKNCPKGHSCPLPCYQRCRPCRVLVECKLKCGHTVAISCAADPETYPCPVQEDAISPHCNHAVKKACHESLDECRCVQICGIRLPCGHPCNLKCHVRQDPDHLKHICRRPCLKSSIDCPMEHPCKLQCFEECKPCVAVVSKKRSCGHDRNVKCSENVEDILCYKLIPYERSCGHKATVRCYRKDAQCEDLTTKISPCGHKVLVKCYQTATSSHCHSKCERKLPCGHPCTASCKDPCTTECKVPVPLTRPGLCGHIISVPCHLKETEADSPSLLRYCEKPCQDKLVCGHICQGNCGSCKQGRIHKPCGEKCGRILICGHRCDLSCKQDCPPCQQPCQVECMHSRCDKKCGEPCPPCMESCEAGCKHARCMKWCFELCDIEHCEKPCLALLNCGHECIGFCGDPCPKLCRICNQRELMEEFSLGHENEPNARFVLLEDCGHCIENKGLLKWVSDHNESIQVKTCPRCKTPITRCMRIGNQIKTDFKDIQLVKSKISGNLKKLQNKQAQLVVRVKDIKDSPVAQVFKGMKQVVDRLGSTVTARAAEAALIVLDILGDISNKFEKLASHTVESYTHVEGEITLLLESLPTRGQISDQEIMDIERELQRFHYMTKVCTMESEAGLDCRGNPDDQKPYDSIMQRLVRIEKFSDTIEEKIVEDLDNIQASREKKISLKNERKLIVKAIGFKQGHWYKCPNGHIYSIAQFGRAMRETKCNECEATISGPSQ